MKTRRLAVFALAVGGLLCGIVRPWTLAAQGTRSGAIQEADLREYLSYISSDLLLGRQAFTEGFGMAAGYVAAHLQQWGVQPLGENGTYFQTVKLNDVKVIDDHSTVTVEVNGQSRTFKNGDGVRFATPAGGRQTLRMTGAEFVGYGLYLPGHDDYGGRSVKGKPVIWINGVPAGLPAGTTRIVAGRARHAIAEKFASASITYEPSSQPAGARAATAPPALGTSTQPAARDQPPGRGRAMVNTPLVAVRQGDFVSPENFNRPMPPEISAADELFELLFTGAPKSFAEIKQLVASQQPLPAFTLPAVTLTFNVDATYQVLQTLYSHNVVGMLEGSDARLKDSYVLLGAHLDHIGYLAAPRAAAATGAGRAEGVPGPAPGTSRCANAALSDVINNGADDDGSGTVTELALAKAFATGPRPKRSLVFIWHTGEEFGLYGSKYNADFPVVPLDKVDVQLNIDMVGRDNADSRYSVEGNTVFVVGADRISTELHNTIVDVNASMKKPLKLDYALNDPADPEGIYYRSDHYSYASKGIPIAFFTDGLPADYHCPSDSVDKINFEKMTRIGQLVYQTATAIANRESLLVRDNRGPRSGRGFQGKIGN